MSFDMLRFQRELKKRGVGDAIVARVMAAYEATTNQFAPGTVWRCVKDPDGTYTGRLMMVVLNYSGAPTFVDLSEPSSVGWPQDAVTPEAFEYVGRLDLEHLRETTSTRR